MVVWVCYLECEWSDKCFWVQNRLVSHPESCIDIDLLLNCLPYMFFSHLLDWPLLSSSSSLLFLSSPSLLLSSLLSLFLSSSPSPLLVSPLFVSPSSLLFLSSSRLSSSPLLSSPLLSSPPPLPLPLLSPPPLPSPPHISDIKPTVFMHLQLTINATAD